MYTKDYSQDCF